MVPICLSSLAQWIQREPKYCAVTDHWEAVAEASVYVNDKYSIHLTSL